LSTPDHLTDTLFADLDLAPTLHSALADAGFKNCTPIQAESIPKFLEGKDVAGQAQTGTGKTIAFLLCTLNKLLRDEPMQGRTSRDTRALILAPTRELAIQIEKDAIPLIAGTDIKLGLAYGGTDWEKQKEKIEGGVDILVGTPGRIIDYFKQGVFTLKKCEVVVLDEADRMFDLGFISDLRYLLRRCPSTEHRRNLLFSATLSAKVLELAYEHMGDPVSVKIEADTMTADKVRQVMYYPGNHEKIPLLIGLLQKMQPERTMIFINTKYEAENVWRWLKGNDFSVEVISGDVRQKKRERLLQQFKNGELDIVIATDVAARGLHIPGVTHVFNYDLPDDKEDYVHRIGRTARAGTEGDAISFACETYAFNLGDIEDYIGHKIPLESVDPDLLVEPKPKAPRPERKGPPPGSGNRNRGGGRGGNRGNSGGGRRRR
jgi:ATP-dependent RNA helicase RhlB